MKFYRVIVAAGLLALPAAAGSPADLMAKLTDQDWLARQRAEDALVAQGPAVLDDLNAALAATADVELHERLASAIARIDREALTSATLVDTQKTFDRPVDALRALANHVGLSVNAESEKAAALIEARKAVTLDCRHTPWLVAVLQCAADAGVSVRLIGEQIVVLEKPALDGRPPIVSAGAVAIVADSTRRTETVDLASGRHSPATTLTLSIFTEPKLRLATGSVIFSITSIVDEQNRPLLRKPAKLLAQHLADGRWVCPIGLLALEPAAARIAKVDGELMGNIVTESDDLKIDDLSTLPAEIQTPGGAIGVRSLVQIGNVWTVAIHIPQNRFSGGNLGAFGGRSWQFGDPDMLKITDGHGRRLMTGAPTMATGGDDLEFTLPITLAAPDDPPRAILIRLPSKSREFRVPFAFSDLPVP